MRCRFMRWCSRNTNFHLLFIVSISGYCKLHFLRSGLSKRTHNLFIVNDNTICNDNGEIYWSAASLLLRNQSDKETNFDLCVWKWTCSIVSALACSFLDRKIITIGGRALIFVFLLLTGLVYTRIYLVIRKLIRSQKRPTSESHGNQNIIKKKIACESRNARSCFLIVICFAVFLLPFAVTRAFFTIASVDFTVYRNWSITSVILNSSINGPFPN